MDETSGSKTNKSTTKTAKLLIAISFAIAAVLGSTAILGSIGQQPVTSASAQTTMAMPGQNNMPAMTGGSENNNNATTTTSSTMTNASTTTTTNMTTSTTLGKLIFRDRGHIANNRVVSVTDSSYTIESSYTGFGVVNGTGVKDIGTTTYTSNATGQFSGKGQGLLRASDGGIAGYTLKYAGTQDLQGNSNAEGSMHFTKLATGSLTDLKNATVTFKVQVTPAGAFTLLAWEQK